MVVVASVAQLVEHLHGKEGVTGSSPVGGFVTCRGESRRYQLLIVDDGGVFLLY